MRYCTCSCTAHLFSRQGANVKSTIPIDWAYHTLADVFNYQIRIVRESRPASYFSSSAVCTSTQIVEPSAGISCSPSVVHVVSSFWIVEYSLFLGLAHLASYLGEVLKPRPHLCHQLRSGSCLEFPSALVAQDLNILNSMTEVLSYVTLIDHILFDVASHCKSDTAHPSAYVGVQEGPFIDRYLVAFIRKTFPFASISPVYSFTGL